MGNVQLSWLLNEWNHLLLRLKNKNNRIYDLFKAQKINLYSIEKKEKIS
jgi:hypothetical protein